LPISIRSYTQVIDLNGIPGYCERSIGGKYMQHKSKRGIRSKRGISTVVASILVLAITVALAVGLLTFGSSFMGSQEKMQPPTTDQIKIENVYFASSTSIEVSIRNVGTGTANVTDIYINGQHYAPSAPADPRIPAGQAVVFTVSNITPALSQNQAYTIKAATNHGGENTYTATYS
jgi:flagellin-like protein